MKSGKSYYLNKNISCKNTVSSNFVRENNAIFSGGSVKYWKTLFILGLEKLDAWREQKRTKNIEEINATCTSNFQNYNFDPH